MPRPVNGQWRWELPWCPALQELCVQALGRVCRGSVHNPCEEKLPLPLFIYTRPRLCLPWQAGAPRRVPSANSRLPRRPWRAPDSH